MKNDEPGKFRTGDVVAISVGHFFHDIFGSFLAPVLPLLIEKFSLSYTLAGLLQIAQRTPSLLNPLVGLVADRTSARILVILGPSCTALAMGMLGLAPSYGVVFALLLAGGFSSAVFHVPAPVLVSDSAGGRSRGRGMSFFMLGGELARSIGPLIILSGISLWGFSGTYRLIPLGFGASIFLYLRLGGFKGAETARRRPGKAAGLRQSLMEARGFLLLILGLVLTRHLLVGALTAFLPVYMSSRGAGLWTAGGALSIVQFAGAAGALASGSISDTLGRRNMLLILTITGPMLMGFFLVASGPVLVLLLILLGFVVLSTQPVMLALVQDMSQDRPAFYNGIYFSMSFFVSAVSGLLIGFLGDMIGLRGSFAVCAAFSLLGIPLVLRLPGRKGSRR